MSARHFYVWDYLFFEEFYIDEEESVINEINSTEIFSYLSSILINSFIIFV